MCRKKCRFSHGLALLSSLFIVTVCSFKAMVLSVDLGVISAKFHVSEYVFILILCFN